MNKARWLLCLSSLAAWAADGGGTPTTGTPQASVTNPRREADLTTVSLTPDAVRRLGIATAEVRRQVIAEERLYGGEITPPLAASSPSGGLQLLAPPQTLAELIRIADLQATAEGDVAQAQARLDAAELALKRAERLLAARTGSDRAVEEAQAAHRIARAARDQSASRRALLGPALDASAAGSRWWIRVPVLASDVPGLDPVSAATVTILGNQRRIPVHRVTNAPPTANAATLTLDWYYVVDDPGRDRRPGERVEVRIPALGSTTERLTAPWSAVLHDFHGGQWVYLMKGSNTFTRSRVRVAQVTGSNAVLDSGPPVGSRVVTDGAAELFGVEFGPGK